MSKLVFYDYPADMLEPVHVGFTQFFPAPEPEVLSFDATRIVLSDPLSGATVELRGVFDSSSDVTLLASTVSAMIWRSAAQELLLDWSEGSIALGEVMNAPDSEATIALALGGDDAISGGGGADVLRGYGGSDTIAGNGGDDTLSGDAGDDLLDGRDGIDLVRVAGNSVNFTLRKGGMNLTLTDTTGAEGTDRLLSIEKLQFADKTFDLVNPPRQGVPAFNTNNGFLFDAVFYLLDNAELVPTLNLSTALQHYFSTGAAQGRQPNSWFDPTYYENRWADLKAGNFDDAILFMHYNLYGVWEGRSAGPEFDKFDGNRYLLDNPDVAAYVDAHVNDFLGSRTNGAIAHYVIYGAAEARLAFDLIGQPIDLGYTIDLGG